MAKLANTMTDIEIAWCAGLFEGEGSIHPVTQKSKKRDYTYVRMALKMTDLDVVMKFAQLVKVGTVRGTSRNTASRLPKHYKKAYTWQLSSYSEIIKLISILYPHLGVRRRAKINELGIVITN